MQSSRNKNTYRFFDDAEKCFHELWLRDCLIEMKCLRKGTIEVISKSYTKWTKKQKNHRYKTVGHTKSINIKEIVTQGSIFWPIQGLKNFGGMPYEIVYDIVRYASDFPVLRTIYSLFLMKLQKYYNKFHSLT